MEQPIQIRTVNSLNFADEFTHIQEHIASYPFIAVDTEYPGTVYELHPLLHFALLSQDQRYQNLKANVDNLLIIQLGLTLSDAAGTLPVIGNSRAVWQFNFSDFNRLQHHSNPESLGLLRRTHPTFDADRLEGVPSSLFGELLMSSGVVCNRDSDVNWVTYSGASDFAYLVKILTGNALPETREGFRELVNVYFGERLYDVKHIQRQIPAINVHGGLNGLAERLGVLRAAGEGHHAGSDSLLTKDVFQRIRNEYPEIDLDDLDTYCRVIVGLETR